MSTKKVDTNTGTELLRDSIKKQHVMEIDAVLVKALRSVSGPLLTRGIDHDLVIIGGLLKQILIHPLIQRFNEALTQAADSWKNEIVIECVKIAF